MYVEKRNRMLIRMTTIDKQPWIFECQGKKSLYCSSLARATQCLVAGLQNTYEAIQHKSHPHTPLTNHTLTNHTLHPPEANYFGAGGARRVIRDQEVGMANHHELLTGKAEIDDIFHLSLIHHTIVSSNQCFFLPGRNEITHRTWGGESTLNLEM